MLIDKYHVLTTPLLSYICPDRWLNVNYAEVEFIDKLLGSHHTQSEKIAQYQKTKQQ